MIEKLKPIERRIHLKSLTLKDFMSYSNFHIEFGDVPIHGLYGPNGCGKSTLLHAIRLLFSKFGGFDRLRLRQSLARYKRNNSSSEFEIMGCFTSAGEEYTVKIGSSEDCWNWNRIEGMEGEVVTGVKEGHPLEVRKTLTEQIWMATYDQQLHQFQIEKSRWNRFKPLFEAVTGYEVKPVEVPVDFSNPMLSRGERNSMAEIDRYILGIQIMKPGGAIRENQCSDGEKKVIKHFTTMFNKPDDEIPSIILIDNIEMHIARDRQLPLIVALEGCFPDSQIIFTTHGDSIICHYDSSRLTNLYYKDLDQNVELWRKEAMRLAAVAEMLIPGDESTTRMMQHFRVCSRESAASEIKSFFERCGEQFAGRI